MTPTLTPNLRILTLVWWRAEEHELRRKKALCERRKKAVLGCGN